MTKLNNPELLPKIIDDLRAIREELKNDVAEDENIWETQDVRLRIFSAFSDTYDLFFGDSSYDLDHRGYWGASSVSVNDDDIELATTAEYLLNEAEEAATAALDNPYPNDPYSDLRQNC